MASAKWGKKKRKNDDGTVYEWNRETASVRNPITSFTYLDCEKVAYLSYYDEITGGSSPDEE